MQNLEVMIGADGTGPHNDLKSTKGNHPKNNFSFAFFKVLAGDQV